MTEFTIHELPNGIRIIHQETSSTNIAHLGLFIDVGTRDELEDEEGLAHFIEHVIFKGTKKRSAKQILNRLDSVGGELNAYTGKEDTVIYASCLVEHFGRSAELISDILTNSIFPANELSKEREVVIDEINYYLDTPSEQIFDDFEHHIFPNHPLGRSILGNKELLKTFDYDKIQKFMKRNYTTNRMVISSVGPFSAKKAIQQLSYYFGMIPSSESHRKIITNLRTNDALHKEVKKNITQTHVILGSEAYDVHHPNKTTFTLLNNYIGGPAMNARLNMEVREKHGYTYNIESHYSAFSETGLFSIYFGTEGGNVQKVHSIIRKEIRQLYQKKLGIRKLHAAKQQLVGQIALAQENKCNLMLAIGKSLLAHGKVDPLEEVFKKIDNITAENILEVANETLNQDQHSLTFKPKE